MKETSIDQLHLSSARSAYHPSPIDRSIIHLLGGADRNQCKHLHDDFDDTLIEFIQDRSSIDRLEFCPTQPLHHL